jgi:sialate O-acetylesterase
MRSLHTYWILVLITVNISLVSNAAVKLPALVADGMVLQQNLPLTIWGWADNEEKITLSFLDRVFETNADKNGNWKLTLPPVSAGGPYNMQINDISLRNILVGEVWLCSGQSNMELPVSRVMELYAKEVNEYSNPAIRQFKVALDYNFKEPLTDVKPALWKELTPVTALSFSAVAYFFAKDLYDKLKVPIGIINASVGGSPAEAWISESGLKSFPHYLMEKKLFESEAFRNQISRLNQQESSRWNELVFKSDPGVNEHVKWFEADYDDKKWDEIDLFDKSWGQDGVQPKNGTYWFRKQFYLNEVPENENIKLRLGCVVDADSIYINGVFAGTTSYRYPPRIYSIPAHILRKGENNITIRLFSYSGQPHFMKDKPYELEFQHNKIDLKGKWMYRQGIRMPQLNQQVFFQYKPVGLYNAMVAPVVPYTVKGVLWYQGESNTNRYHEYFDLMSALIADWRSAWKQPDMPFLLVQLANFMEPTEFPAESNWAELRNAQLMLSKKIPNTGLAVTIDIGEWNDIHPLNKKEVGRRLSLQAQHIAYEMKDVIADGPQVKNILKKGNKVIITFNEQCGDIQKFNQISGFEIAAENGLFHCAEASIMKNKLIVKCKDVKKPGKIRYAWANNPVNANLMNKSGIPASPFTCIINK